jgi:hypothetical protein
VLIQLLLEHRSTNSVGQPVGTSPTELITAYQEHKKRKEYCDDHFWWAEYQIWWAEYNHAQGLKLVPTGWCSERTDEKTHLGITIEKTVEA